ncbi:MAG TPA: ScyD/ScyE family protein [Caldilineaceae bacterium]|nr:ScyD/ScyE family protein [Caldilineaceae bacterium]
MIFPNRTLRPLALLVGLVLLSACIERPLARPFATGLNQPRGMAFDSAGNLFVAETGGRAASAAGETPADTNHSGRVVRFSPAGQATPILEGLPYTYYGEIGDSGAADVALLAGVPYVLTGEGYDDRLARAVLRPLPDRSPQVVVSLLHFAIGLSTVQEQQIGTVMSNPYGMVAAPDNSALYVSDAASGRILHVTLDGAIRVFAELPMTPLAGMAFGPDGRLYVAMFSLRPHLPGSGAVWAADPSGEPPSGKLEVAVQGLTMPVDVGFAASGAMYVLEFGQGSQPDRLYPPQSGRLLRIAEDGAPAVVLDRLNYPTALAFSPGGDLYIAVGGAFTAPGEGAILRLACRTLEPPDACPPAAGPS